MLKFFQRLQYLKFFQRLNLLRNRDQEGCSTCCKASKLLKLSEFRSSWDDHPWNLVVPVKSFQVLDADFLGKNARFSDKQTWIKYNCAKEVKLRCYLVKEKKLRRQVTRRFNLFSCSLVYMLWTLLPLLHPFLRINPISCIYDR